MPCVCVYVCSCLISHTYTRTHSHIHMNRTCTQCVIIRTAEWLMLSDQVHLNTFACSCYINTSQVISHLLLSLLEREQNIIKKHWKCPRNHHRGGPASSHLSLHVSCFPLASQWHKNNRYSRHKQLDIELLSFCLSLSLSHSVSFHSLAASFLWADSRDSSSSFPLVSDETHTQRDCARTQPSRTIVTKKHPVQHKKVRHIHRPATHWTKDAGEEEKCHQSHFWLYRCVYFRTSSLSRLFLSLHLLATHNLESAGGRRKKSEHILTRTPFMFDHHYFHYSCHFSSSSVRTLSPPGNNRASEEERNKKKETEIRNNSNIWLSITVTQYVSQTPKPIVQEKGSFYLSMAIFFLLLVDPPESSTQHHESQLYLLSSSSSRERERVSIFFFSLMFFSFRNRFMSPVSIFIRSYSCALWVLITNSVLKDNILFLSFLFVLFRDEFTLLFFLSYLHQCFNWTLYLSVTL